LSYWSDPFHDGCSPVFANIHYYFHDSARVRRFYIVSKARGNVTASLLSFMKLSTYPIDNCYDFNMIFYAIRNFTFEYSNMTTGGAYKRLWILLTVHFAAKIEVFVVIHIL
jgi:hypothetical protein